jgi:hypothetical protein
VDKFFKLQRISLAQAGQEPWFEPVNIFSSPSQYFASPRHIADDMYTSYVEAETDNFRGTPVQLIDVPLLLILMLYPDDASTSSDMDTSSDMEIDTPCTTPLASPPSYHAKLAHHIPLTIDDFVLDQDHALQVEESPAAFAPFDDDICPEPDQSKAPANSDPTPRLQDEDTHPKFRPRILTEAAFVLLRSNIFLCPFNSTVLTNCIQPISTFRHPHGPPTSHT